MKTIARIVMAVVIFFAFFVYDASAQAACNPSGAAAPVVPGRALLTFVSPSHNALDAGKQPIVNDYFAEVFVSTALTTAISNFTIPKASLKLETGAIADCYSVLLPSLALLPTNLYVLTVRSRGNGGTAVSTVSNPFYLAGAPLAPTSISVFTP